MKKVPLKRAKRRDDLNNDILRVLREDATTGMNANAIVRQLRHDIKASSADRDERNAKAVNYKTVTKYLKDLTAAKKIKAIVAGSHVFYSLNKK
jgi:hypothetical protein